MTWIGLLLLVVTVVIAPRDPHAASTVHVLGTVALGLFGMALFRYEDPA